MGDEKVFLSNSEVTVTQARVVTPGQTYAMSGVTSVRRLAFTPSRKMPIGLIVLGLIPLASGETGGVLAGLLAIGMGIAWLAVQKTSHVVALQTSGGEQRAFESTDANLVAQIVNAINEAMIARG